MCSVQDVSAERMIMERKHKLVREVTIGANNNLHFEERVGVVN